MRTTVTLDPDTESLIRRLMAERSISFKQALNYAIRAGAQPERRSDFVSRTWHMGVPAVTLDRATQLSGELEDEILVRRMHSGQ